MSSYETYEAPEPPSLAADGTRVGRHAYPNPALSPAFEAAVTELFQQRFYLLVRYLDRLTDDPGLAQDVAQEAFVRLHQRGEMPDDPAAWLITVATNLVRDARRTEQRRTALLSEYSAHTFHAPHLTPVDDRLIVEEERRWVRSALQSLSLRDQQLLLLRHEGYSYRELARLVGVSETSVGTLLSRATQAFRAVLAKGPHVRFGTAAMLLVVATVAAAAVPKSPLRHLLERIFVSPAPTQAVVPRMPVSPPLAATTPGAARSVAITPNGPVTIRFQAGQPAGVIRVTSGSGARVTVSSDADGARYAVGQDLIMIDRTSVNALNYTIELPPADQCPPVRVYLDDQLVYSRTGDRVHATATRDESGAYTIPLRAR